MSREARKRSNQASRHSANHGGSALSGWMWGLFGLSAGLFVALLVYLHYQTPHGAAAVKGLFQPQASNTAGAGKQQSPDHTPAPDNSPSHPQFEFYKLLPDQKVQVPLSQSNITPTPVKPPAAAKPPTLDNDAYARPARPQEKASPPDTPEANNTAYLLQVGSFRRLNEADQLKAKLALLGIEASIQSVELASGETWHRVQVGPFSDPQHLNEVRKRLQAKQIHAIVLMRGG